MARNSTTRAPGNGAGWGGPAKGAGQAPGVKGGAGGRPPGVANGQGKRSIADLMADAGARELTAQRWLEILNDPAHPHHATMIAKAADRMDGAPVARMDHTIRDVAAEDMTDDDLAAIAARGRKAATATQGD